MLARLTALYLSKNDGKNAEQAFSMLLRQAGISPVTRGGVLTRLVWV